MLPEVLALHSALSSRAGRLRAAAASPHLPGPAHSALGKALQHTHFSLKSQYLQVTRESQICIIRVYEMSICVMCAVQV